ncbi:MAG: PadR family transcriptional regulator [Thermoleophilaceae bacterium]
MDHREYTPLQELRLTPASYIVLGLVEWAGTATPYDLKRYAAASVGNLWSIQHAQLYSEPARLAKAGYLKEKREDGGRRRKTYSITARGRRTLSSWLAEPASETAELRDPGLLKLFFGADPKLIAPQQVEIHERKLAAYERIHAGLAGTDLRGPRLTLEAGIRAQRAQIGFWRDLA